MSPGVCGPALHSAAASEDPLSAERFRLGVRHSATSSSSSDNRNRAAIMATAVLTEFVVCFAPSNGFLLYQCLYRHWKQWVGCLFGLPVGCVFWELKCFSGPSALVRRLVSVQTADPLCDLGQQCKESEHTTKHNHIHKILSYKMHCKTNKWPK